MRTSPLFQVGKPAQRTASPRRRQAQGNAHRWGLGEVMEVERSRGWNRNFIAPNTPVTQSLRHRS